LPICGPALLDRRDRGPTSFPGIGDAPREPVEGRRVVQRRRREVQEPGRYDAPPSPELRHRRHIDVAAVAELWRRGSVVSSWLLDLTAAALHDSPTLDGFAGRVADSGEGRWTAIAAVEEGGPADRK